MLHLSLAVFLGLAARATATADLVMVKDTSVACLDGSPAGYYMQPGAAGNKTFIIALQGGGVCSHFLDCTARSKSDLGSSKGWAKQTTLNELQSSDPSANPAFHGATMIWVPYCTGDVHSGTRAASSDTWGLHFDGHNIFRAIVAQLHQDAPGFSTADLVILAGYSAGGMGVHYNVDYLTSQMPTTTRVLGLPIGGYIFPHPNYDGPGHLHESETCEPDDFIRYYALFQPYTGEACNATRTSATAWECLAPTTLFQYITTPMVVVESQIDSVIMFGFSDAPAPLLPTPDVQAYAKDFRANSTQFADRVQSSQLHTIFSVCCFMHTTFARAGPTVNGQSYYDLLVRAAIALGDKAPPPASLLDTCATLNCGTACPHTTDDMPVGLGMPVGLPDSHTVRGRLTD
jgi:hypothetical protein